jgi:hypothetical protein
MLGGRGWEQTTRPEKKLSFSKSFRHLSYVLNKIITMQMLPTRDCWLGMTYPDGRLRVENLLNQWIALGMYSI